MSDRLPNGLTPKKESRLRLRVAEEKLALLLAEAGVEVAEGNAVRAALTELVRTMVGKDENGNPAQVSRRTRARAADILLRFLERTAHPSTRQDLEVSGELSLVDLVRQVAAQERVTLPDRMTGGRS